MRKDGAVTSRVPVSGSQFELVAGEYRATIASVGATLRRLTFAGRDLVVPFAEDEVRPFFRGAVLAPWPNRVIDGRYSFDGEARQLSLTEPARGHALHGLAAWLDWQPVDDEATRPADRVSLRTVVEAQPGYPHRIALTTTYSLDENGLTTTVEAVNTGDSAAPYGTGPHPYLVAGPGRVDEWFLDLPASDVFTFTGERLIPDALVDVATADDGTFDFRDPRPIGSTFIDHAFTSLTSDDDTDDAAATPTFTVRVLTADGSGAAITWGAELPWVQVHTADQPVAELDRIGLAVEPMTCPPDAFNSGTDLVVLAPEGSHAASWTIFAL